VQAWHAQPWHANGRALECVVGPKGHATTLAPLLGAFNSTKCRNSIGQQNGCHALKSWEPCAWINGEREGLEDPSQPLQKGMGWNPNFSPRFRYPSRLAFFLLFAAFQILLHTRRTTSDTMGLKCIRLT
jgi:hypothetical protein